MEWNGIENQTFKLTWALCRISVDVLSLFSTSLLLLVLSLLLLFVVIVVVVVIAVVAVMRFVFLCDFCLVRAYSVQ